MFAYCNNNPINCRDLNGKRHIEHADIAGNGQHPHPGTISAGVSANVPIGIWSVGGQLFVTTDSYNNTVLQGTFYGNPTTNPSFNWKSDFSLICFVMITNVSNYRELEGPGVSAGYASPSAPSVIIDYVGMQDSNNPERIKYHGILIGEGMSSPGPHGSWGETFTILTFSQFNVYDYFNNVYNHMMQGGFL